MLETTGLGAAFLAGLGTGVWSSTDELAQTWRLDRRFEPSAYDDEGRGPPAGGRARPGRVHNRLHGRAPVTGGPHGPSPPSRGRGGPGAPPRAVTPPPRSPAPPHPPARLKLPQPPGDGPSPRAGHLPFPSKTPRHSTDPPHHHGDHTPTGARPPPRAPVATRHACGGVRATPRGGRGPVLGGPCVERATAAGRERSPARDPDAGGLRAGEPQGGARGTGALTGGGPETPAGRERARHPRRAAGWRPLRPGRGAPGGEDGRRGRGRDKGWGCAPLPTSFE